MIITKKVKLKVNAVSVKHYRELGYIIPQKNIEIEIEVEDLSKGNHTIVDVKCDICGRVNQMEYRTYLRVIEGGFYTCNTCKCVKSKCTLERLYGDKNFNNRKKYKETCQRKFGCDNGFQNENIKDEIKKVSRIFKRINSRIINYRRNEI